MPERFSDIALDVDRTAKLASSRRAFVAAAKAIDAELPTAEGAREPYGRNKALAMTGLEAAFDCAKRALQDEQAAYTD